MPREEIREEDRKLAWSVPSSTTMPPKQAEHGQSVPRGTTLPLLQCCGLTLKGRISGSFGESWFLARLFCSSCLLFLSNAFVNTLLSY